MTKRGHRSSGWVKIYEPGQPQHAFNILCEINPAAAVIRIVRRKRESLINLREYGLVPKKDDPLDKEGDG